MAGGFTQFKSPKAIIVAKVTKAPKVKVPKDLFPSEVNIENRRITGVTPRLTKQYSNPARLLPKAKVMNGLKSAGSMKG